MTSYIVLGSNGLLGSSVVTYFLENNEHVIGVDISKQNIFNHKNYFFISKDLTELKSVNSFVDFIDSLLSLSSNIINIIDCTLICPKCDLGHADNIQSIWAGMLTLQVLLTKSMAQICQSKDLKSNLILTSSIKSIKAPKFWHYEDLDMNSDVEYAIAKAGINILIKDATVRYSNYMRCNAVAPGGLLGERHDPKFVMRYEKSCTDGGLVNPLSVAKTIYFLMSPSCEISGQVILIDNGWSLT